MSINWGIKKRKLTKEEDESETLENEIDFLKLLSKPKLSHKSVSRINNDIYFYIRFSLCIIYILIYGFITIRCKDFGF